MYHTSTPDDTFIFGCGFRFPNPSSIHPFNIEETRIKTLKNKSGKSKTRTNTNIVPFFKITF